MVNTQMSKYKELTSKPQNEIYKRIWNKSVKKSEINIDKNTSLFIKTVNTLFCQFIGNSTIFLSFLIKYFVHVLNFI